MRLHKGLTRAIQGARGSAKSFGIPREILTLDNPAGWTTGDIIGMSRDRAMKISTVNRCVEVLSTSMAVLPIYIMDEGTKERVSKHRLGPVLWSRANEAMSSFDYSRLMMCNQLLRGNAYAWIHRDKVTGYPIELIPLPPDYVSMAISSAGHPVYFFTNPESGERTKIDNVDMLHYKAYSEDGLKGISVLRRASMTLDTAQAAQQYENSTWQNGGQPSGVLETDSDIGGYWKDPNGDGAEEHITKKERVRREWERIHGGPGNAFRIAVLDHGLKYHPISMTNTDAQFVQSNEIRVADVCRFFGVPLHLAYAGKQSYSSNEQNGIEYVNYTLLGYETQWGQEDTYKLLPMSERADNLRIKRELKVFLKGDTTAQAAWYTSMRNNGAFNADEIRALEDMPSIPGGASYYASWNYGPLADWERLSVLRAMGGKAEDGGNE